MVNQIFHLGVGTERGQMLFCLLFCACPAISVSNSFIAGPRMDTMQEDNQELEYNNPNEEQGGIRRRLRDRDLLRKRKAEAEEKETNQAETQRKRTRVQNRSGSKKRGRPRKTEPSTEIMSVTQEETPAPQEASAAAAVAVSESLQEVIPDPTSGPLSFLPAVEPQPSSVFAAPAPLLGFESVQSPIFASAVPPPASVDPAPAPLSPSASAPAPTKDLDPAEAPVQGLDSSLVPGPDAVPVPTLTQTPIQVPYPAPPVAPFQVEALYREPESRETLYQVMIEDLGPDEEEDISSSQDQRAGEDLSETPSINVPKQNKMLPVPALSSLPPAQEYLPGN